MPPLGLVPLIALILTIPSAATAPVSDLVALAPIEIVAAGFQTLRGLALDRDGNVAVADRETGTVTRLGRDGHRVILAAGLKRPVGLAFDPDGRLLIVEEQAGRVVRLEPSGARGPVLSGLKQPRWLALGDTGTLYVSARRSKAGFDPDPDDESAEPELIVALTAGGRVSIFADGFKRLQGLAVGQGVLYAAAEGHGDKGPRDGAIYRIAIMADGRAGGIARLAASGTINKPIALARDALGGLFVTTKELRIDGRRTKQTIAKLHTDARLTRFASQLDDPQGLAFDADGDLYVADGRGGRVLRFRAPAVPALTSLPPFTNQAVLAITGTTEPTARVDVFVDEAAVSATALAGDAGAFSVPVTLTRDAANALEVFTTGRGGDGLTAPPIDVTVEHDGTAPGVGFQSPAAGAFVRQRVTVQAQSSDRGSGIASVALRIDGQPMAIAVTPPVPSHAVTGTGTWNSTGAADGTHTLRASALDRAGNSVTVDRIVIVDNTPPETQITAGPSGDGADTVATLSFSGSDNLTPTGSLVFAWRLDGGPFTPFEPATTATLSGLAEGAHLFEVKTRDLAGNDDPTPAIRQFTVPRGPTIASVTPDAGAVGAVVTIGGARFEPLTTRVAFNGTPAVLHSISPTTITTTVPLGATSGIVSVTTSAGTARQPFTVTRTADFTLSVVPERAAMVAGGSLSYSVRVDGSSDFAGLVQLSVGGAPGDFSVSVSPGTLGPGQTASVSIQIPAGSTAGVRSLTIGGTAAIDGGAVGRSQVFALDVLPPGTTALAGRVLDTDGLPVEGVTLTLGARHTSSDGAGNFLLRDVMAGTDQFLFLDGSTAIPDRKYPSFPFLVTVEAGKVNVLPFTPFLHAQKTVGFTPIVPAQETVVKDPDIPGFEMRIPADVTIIGWDGQPNTKVSVRTLPIDRMPLPRPDPPIPSRSVYMFYFDKVGGGVPTRPVPVTAMNDLGLAPGERAELWYYDEGPTPGSAATRWLMAGTATVGADGTTITTDPGVGLPRFCCGAFRFAATTTSSTSEVSLIRDGVRGGEPVDLATGLFVLEATDLVLPGRLPLVVTRTYRTNDVSLGPFGRGTSAFFTEVVERPTPETLIYIEPGNTRTTFTRGADGRFRNETAPGLRGTLFTPHPDGTLTLRLRDGGSKLFEPTLTPTTLQIRQIADRVGNRITFVRDSIGRPIALVGPSGQRLELAFSGFSSLVDSVRDPLGRMVRYGYDTAFRLVSVTDPAGGHTVYAYDHRNNLTTITDPRGHIVLSNEYGASGRVLKQTQADGATWRFAYTLSGARVTGPGCPGLRCPDTESLDEVLAGRTFTGGYVIATVLTDPRGHATTYRFNNFGYLIERIDPLGLSTKFERGMGTNVLLSTTDPLGRVTRFTHDASGNVTSVTDSAGHLRRLTYESTFNKVTALTDPLGGTTTLTYDGAGNLTAIADPLGNRTTLSYDQVGQPVSVRDPLGHATTFAYDAVGNLLTITDPEGNARTRVYDAASRLVSEADARGVSTGFAYDALSRVTTIVDGRGGTTGITYDANGNVVRVTDARGHATTYAYDPMNRLVRRTDGAGASESFTYDGFGNPVSHVDRKGRTSTFAYDASNRRTAAVHPDSTVNVVYDVAGRMSQTTDSLGGTILYRYDALDRLTSETTELGTIAYQHDALGRRTAMTTPGQPPVTYGYDAASRPTTITRAAHLVQLDYDAAGRRSRLTLPNQVSTQYGYDAASRLTALIYRNATGILGDLIYQYDAVGNRVAVSGSLARTVLPAPVSVASYDGANRQVTFGDKVMTYDVNGNLTSITDPAGTTSLAWDARDRLVGVITPPESATWTYDASGRRARSRIGERELTHLYDGYDLVQSHSEAGTTTFLRTLAIDEALARDSAEFYLSDALGSTVALTAPDGSLLTRYTYEPFGRTEADGTASPNPFQFTGRENDTLASLYSYRTRPYSPTLHRFLSEDPLGWLAGPNSYVYALNSPLLFSDPLGLDAVVVLYEGQPGNVFGHIGIGINSPTTSGFYAIENSFRMLSGQDVVGILREDTLRPRDRIRITTTLEKDERMKRLVQERLASPGPYNLLQRNCVTFVVDVLRAGGLQAVNTNQPRVLMEYLQTIYGSRLHPAQTLVAP